MSAILVKRVNEICEFMTATNFVVDVLVIFFLNNVKYLNVKNFSVASVCNVSVAIELFRCGKYLSLCHDFSLSGVWDFLSLSVIILYHTLIDLSRGF